MIYVFCFISVCLNFIFIAKWAYAEGMIDNLIRYLNINYPDAFEGINRDYIVHVGHVDYDNVEEE